MPSPLISLSQSLQKYGKENLAEIVHFLALGIKDLFKCDQVRIYLEDLYEGMLICHYATGQNSGQANQAPQFISPKKSIISRSFYENRVTLSWDLENDFSKNLDPVETVSGIKASAAFPIASEGRPVGILSLDWKKAGNYLDKKQIQILQNFLMENCAVITKAKNFHQKINFSKHLDLARKKEAVSKMVRSAVNLIDKLTLASVLVPSVTQSTKEEEIQVPDDSIEVLATYSKNRDSTLIYNTQDRISILNDHNLINRILQFKEDQGLIAREPSPSTIYIEDVKDEKFKRKAIAKQIDLVSLFQIPKFDKKTGQFICAVNYYTDVVHRFNAIEKCLLEEHANMVVKIILEDNPERMEIQVLSEIEELLSDPNSTLQSFLNKILSKTSELLGADSGSISLVKYIDSKPWLLVEDDHGNSIGAKSQGFKKNRIPPLPLGGKELPDSLRSLTGNCAHVLRPMLIKDVHDLNETKGFYKNLSSFIRSEVAVPMIFGNQVLGVINQDSFSLNYFTHEHQHILQIVSRLINQKVHNLIQIEELKKESQQLSRDIQYRDPKVTSYYFGNIIGKSKKINTLIKQIDTVVQSVCNRMVYWRENGQPETLIGLPSLLITGQTGTGKEFFFNNIYSRLCEIFGNEKGSEFKLPVKKTNIGAYSGELSYSELFGHKKGAFTGADSNRCGILEDADGGVVFLDEIGDTDPKTQIQLLRFLDTGVFVRLGENEPRYSKILLVAATNKNLLDEIQSGRFREDLYHRLNELSFHIPSLNDRKEDIEDLAIHFLGKLYHTYKNDSDDQAKPYLETDAIEFLKNYHFRGNVRELRNILLRAMLFRKNPGISGSNLFSAANSVPSPEIAFNQIEDKATDKEAPEKSKSSNSDFWKEITVDKILARLEAGSSDFWTEIHRPFKNNEMTRDTVITLINVARTRYRTNLPGLAIKLNVCHKKFNIIPEEKQKFVSFKNFLYKTVRLTEY